MQCLSHLFHLFLPRYTEGSILLFPSFHQFQMLTFLELKEP